VLFLFSLCFFLLGYFRNYIFLTVNDRASALYYNSPSPPLNGILSILESYTYNGLITVKWILTFLFTFLFSILSAVTIYFVFKERKYIYTSFAIYTLVFIISLLFILIGKLFISFFYHGFNISRSLAHLEQSPVITIVLLLAIYYSRKTRKT
jgi:hypothetical protein